MPDRMRVNSALFARMILARGISYVTPTREQVAHVARLSRLTLEPAELELMTTQLGAILEYIECLESVETSTVEPMAHAVERENVFREDVETPLLTREEALANAPKTDGRYFLVPAIIDPS